MMRSLRSLATALGLAASLLVLPGASGAAPVCAATDGDPHAGLVVDTGAGTSTYCVSLDASSVSGIHLIELASAQYGLQYHLGYGGMAVCQLQGVGPSGDDCFGDYPYFWGYWRGNGGTGWIWSSTGAGSTSVSDGQLDGWSWGTGDNGSTHPPPPPLGFGDVCAAPTPSPEPSPSSEPSPSPPPPSPSRSTGGVATGGGKSGASSSSATATPQPSESPSKGASGSTASEPSSASPDLTATTTSGGATLAGGRPPDSGSRGSRPVGALLALGIVLTLGVAGALRARAGRSAGSGPAG